jgi:phenylalanyl-tRNA synthetase beta subunit
MCIRDRANTKKKITFRISIRNTEKTLTEKDLKKITESISSKVAKATEGILI